MPERDRRGRPGQTADTSYPHVEGERRHDKVIFTARPGPIVEPFGERKHEICGYCRNNLREVCLTECQPTQDYHKLAPLPKERIVVPPKLPGFEQMATWSSHEQRAMTYLMLYYLRSLIEDR
jgi:hypothetical protein